MCNRAAVVLDCTDGVRRSPKMGPRWRRARLLACIWHNDMGVLVLAGFRASLCLGHSDDATVLP